MRVIGFEDASFENSGFKAAGLSEVFKLNLPLAPGFVVTTKGFDEFLNATGIRQKISELIPGFDLSDESSKNKFSEEVKSMVLKANIPEELVEELILKYNKLCLDEDSKKRMPVLVRSSHFHKARKLAFFLNISSSEMFLDSIKKCWAHGFSKKFITPNKVGEKLGIVVQLMMQPERFGIMLCEKEKPENVVVKAWMKRGSVDTYLVDKDFNLMDKELSSKEAVLSDREARALARFSKRTDKELGQRKLKFAIQRNNLYILDCEPVEEKEEKKREEEKPGIKEEEKLKEPEEPKEPKDAFEKELNRLIERYKTINPSISNVLDLLREDILKLKKQ